MFKRNFKISLVISLIFGVLSPSVGMAVTADFQASIDAKSMELETISNQIKDTTANLNKLAGQKKTLSNELKKIDYTLSQTNLGIKSSQIKLDKLNLELQSLGGQVDDTKFDIFSKKEAIGETIKAINKSDRDGLIQVLLKNKSLVNGAFEVQALKDVQNVLGDNIRDLTMLQSNLEDNIATTASKKTQIEAENQNLKVRKSLAQDQQVERKDLLSSTKNKEQIYQQQLNSLQKRQEDIANEIEQLEYELRGKIDAREIPAPRRGILLWPVPEGVLTQGYGSTGFARANYKGHWHNGIDIGRFLGAEIVAAEDGTVLAVGNQDNYCPRGAYGKFIVIKHHNGLTTLYGHMSAQKVKIGQEVARGEVVGYMGKTGWATGPHLHFVVYDSNTYRL